MHTRYNSNIYLTALLLAALIFVLFPAASVRAQAGSAMDLVNAVNAYRSQNGLEPYGVDGGLMALAQGQSEYQASVETCTHTRADGSSPGDHGISAENIACGLNISPSDAINAQWTDPLHSATMLGPTTGLVGAGVANAGSTVYYTLAVKRLTGDFTYRPPKSENPPAGDHPQDQPTQEPPVGNGNIEVSTPNPDGSIAHVIKYGETLVEIAKAYNISLNDLISMNKLDPNKPVYYAGQPLIIRLAFTATPFVTATYTPRPPTRTPLPSRTPRPTRSATVIRTPAPTSTATREPLVKLPSIDELGPARPVMAYAFIGISALGLIVLLFTAFLPGKKQ